MIKYNNKANKDTRGITDQVDNSYQIDQLFLEEGISTKNIQKTFGREEDHIELHIYNLNNDLISSDLNFTQYSIPKDSNKFTNELLFDAPKILLDRGFISGKYKLKFNILRQKIFQTDSYPFYIKSISSDRREIKSTTPDTNNKILEGAVGAFMSEIESSPYFKEFTLNFGNDLLIPCINILLNKDSLSHEVLYKSLNPLPSSISNKSIFKVVEEIVDPFIIEYTISAPPLVDNNIPLMGPNFNIDVRSKSSMPSTFKTYDNILEYGVTSSYNHLLNRLENSEIPNIQYDYIRPIEESMEATDIPYHFEGFVHFSKAEERLKNFKYKVELLELYDSQINEINSILGDTSSSFNVLNDKKEKTDKKQNLIKGFDGYEHFLYFESGAYSWPKTNISPPYTLSTITSTDTKTWLGSKNSNNSNYGGQLLSASLYDRINPHN